MAEKYYDIDDINFGSPISVYVPLAILDLDPLVNRNLPYYASRMFRFERCVDGPDIAYQITHNSVGNLGLIRLSRLTDKETLMLISGVPPVTADEMFASEANKELYRDEGHEGFKRQKAETRARILRMIFKGLNAHLEWIEPIPAELASSQPGPAEPASSPISDEYPLVTAVFPYIPHSGEFRAEWQQLPPMEQRYREDILDLTWDGYTSRSIATKTGIPSSTIRAIWTRKRGANFGLTKKRILEILNETQSKKCNNQ